MSLKKSLFLLSVGCVFVSLVLIILVFLGCGAIRGDYPASGISFSLDGAVTRMEPVTAEQQRMLSLMSLLEIFPVPYFHWWVWELPAAYFTILS